MTIDARMLFASGIGTSLRNILQRCRSPESVNIVFVADDRGREFVASHFPGAKVVDAPAPIYSISEQFYAPRFAQRGGLFWSPHYNIPLLHSGPLIATVHDVLHVAHPHLFGGWHKIAYAAGMLRATGLRAQEIICVSEFTRGEYLRVTGTDPAKVRVIHNGVDESWFVEDESIRPLIDPYLLFVGNIKPHKNLPRLIAAFDVLAEKIPHKLVIIGADRGLRTVDANVRAAAARWPDRIVFPGEVSEAALKAYYRNADLFVFPSYYEGFGLPPLEAMAAGTLVAAGRAAALPEICGEAAAYFDPFDVQEMAECIGRLLELSTAERTMWCERGRARAREFAWERAAESYWDVLLGAAA